jgi:hypothetical protein
MAGQYFAFFIAFWQSILPARCGYGKNPTLNGVHVLPVYCYRTANVNK